MNFVARIGLLLGLLLLIALLLWQGALDVLRLLMESGWYLLLLPLVWLPSFIPATESWRYLFRPGEAPPFRRCVLATWIGRAVNNTLPVASIGGEVIKARLLVIWGYNGIAASSSVIVDKTVQVVAVVLWGLTGVVLLLSMSLNNSLAIFALAGFGILTLSAVALFYFQRAGMFGFLAHHGGKLLKVEGWEGVKLSAREVDGVVYASYLRRRRFILACLVKTLGLVLQTAEVWLGCYLLGHPVSLMEAAMLKSLTSTLSDIAFIIPNAYGIQEGLFIALGALVGLDPELCLALSLALRIRDLILDPTGLLLLHHYESRQLIKRAGEIRREN